MSEYDPNGLLDEVSRKLGVKNDAALSRAFDVAPPVVSKLRHQRMNVGPSIILKCHEIAGLSLPTIRSFIGGKA
jgi:hypothetical protein